jgi:predicted signal transduction protein with EAL and GGDEF domain
VLGIAVIAEGVESSDELERLRDWGCREVQGYYFPEPLEPDAMSEYLRRGLPTAGACEPGRHLAAASRPVGATSDQSVAMTTS